MQESIAFAWPYALVFWLVFLWAFGSEFQFLAGKRETSTFARDAKSKPVLLVGQYLALNAGFAISLFVRATALQHPAVWGWLGIAMMIAGSMLRRHCWKMLGESFTGTVIVKPDQEVVERGIYRYVRHPSYTGGTLMLLGVSVALANWLSILVILTFTAISYGYRVRVEESALVTVIGEPYRRYMSRTKRFIPLLF